MEVSGQLNAPAALLPGNNAGSHRTAGSVESTAGLYIFGEEKNLFATPTTLLRHEGELAIIKKPAKTNDKINFVYKYAIPPQPLTQTSWTTFCALAKFVHRYQKYQSSPMQIAGRVSQSV
jgi:hypothetical protein